MLHQDEDALASLGVDGEILVGLDINQDLKNATKFAGLKSSIGLLVHVQFA